MDPRWNPRLLIRPPANLILRQSGKPLATTTTRRAPAKQTRKLHLRKCSGFKKKKFKKKNEKMNLSLVAFSLPSLVTMTMVFLGFLRGQRSRKNHHDHSYFFSSIPAPPFFRAASSRVVYIYVCREALSRFAIYAACGSFSRLFFSCEDLLILCMFYRLYGEWAFRGRRGY